MANTLVATMYSEGRFYECVVTDDTKGVVTLGIMSYGSKEGSVGTDPKHVADATYSTLAGLKWVDYPGVDLGSLKTELMRRSCVGIIRYLQQSRVKISTETGKIVKNGRK